MNRTTYSPIKLLSTLFRNQLKRGTKIKLKQLVILTISWMIMGFIITVYDHLVLHTSNAMGPSEEYSFLLSAIRNVGAGFIGALLGGSLLIFYVNVNYNEKPYGYTIVIVATFFLLVVAIITLVMGAIIVPLQTGKPLFDPVSLITLQAFVTDSYPIKNALVWSFIVATTQLFLQISSKFGPDTFWDIVRGKYNTPKEEHRIFMFLDINSSTTIAEQLGDETYHNLLKDFFADITNPILDNNGIIYQYVGDEVVVSWNYEDRMNHERCIGCFFDMKLEIERKKEKYLRKYGLVPTFKAGIHCGKIVAGEVGIIKRDITFSGDVLNTTSRILNKCNEFNAEVIASSNLLTNLDFPLKYMSRPLGSIKLKGRHKEVQLNAIESLFAS